MSVSCKRTESLQSRWTIWRAENGERKEVVKLDEKIVPNQEYLSLYIPEGILSVGNYFLDLQVGSILN